MGSAHDRERDGQVGPELLEQLRAQAEVLGVFDEGQDIALDLHEGLFDPSTRQRALAFLQSRRYETAAVTFQHLTTPAVRPHQGDAA